MVDRIGGPRVGRVRGRTRPCPRPRRSRPARARLPPARHRTSGASIVLHYYLGFTLDEIADTLGVPPGTVRSRLHRATGALRAALDADARSIRSECEAVGMTARDDFDRHLAAWLDDRAPMREPEPLLGQVLARTARTRRRPAWLIPERWIPMSVHHGPVTHGIAARRGGPSGLVGTPHRRDRRRARSVDRRRATTGAARTVRPGGERRRHLQHRRRHLRARHRQWDDLGC